MVPDESTRREFAWRLGLTITGVACLAAAAALLISAASVLLLVFAGILVAVLLRGCADAIAGHTPLRPGWSLALFLGLVIGLIVAAGAVIIPASVTEFSQLGSEIATSLDELERSLSERSWGRELLGMMPEMPDLRGRFDDAIGRARGFFSTTFGGLASLFVMLFIGLYLAASPGTYTMGLVRLFPDRLHVRVRQVLLELQVSLWRWLLGRLVGILVVGLLTWIGLLILGLPLAMPLALLAAVLAFVPNLGPVLAVLPALVLGLVQGVGTVLWVMVLYSAVQAFETYLITPLVARRVVSLPPVLTIVVQIVMGMYFGILGLLLAGPMAVVVMVLVQMVYLKGVLGRPIESRADGRALGDDPADAG